MVKVVRFSGSIPNLTSVNSTVIQGRVIWLTKKNDDQKEYKTYAAYDFKTKIKLGSSITKDSLIEFLTTQDFSEIDKVNDKINGVLDDSN